MGKETITMTCGHEETHNIVGAIKSRDYKAARIAERVCSACAAKERKDHNAICAQENQAAGFPALTGSEKQIAWAESIRNEVLSAINESGIRQENAEKILSAPQMRETFAGKIIDGRETYKAVAKQLRNLKK